MAANTILKGLGYAAVASIIAYKKFNQNDPWSVSDKEITKDSSGAIIFEGSYGTEPTARKAAVVKRGRFNSDAEYTIYLEADSIRNVVRCYGTVTDWSYVCYLFLEPCVCSLDDLIRSYSPKYVPHYSSSTKEERLRKSVKNIVGERCRFTLWKENGYPSPLLLTLMRDVVRGLAKLHEKKIVYRNMNPQNILIAEQTPLCAKLSNMVYSKKFIVEISSSNHRGNSLEQFYFEREAAEDLSHLGRVLSFCISASRGRTPPESKDLISQLVSSEIVRPKAKDVHHHPLFWDSDMKLSFLRDTSDMVEGNRRTEFSKALGLVQSQVMGTKWNTKIDSAIIEGVRLHGDRLYNYNKFLDLLRFVRNMLNHYHELSKKIELFQELLGPIPEEFYDYFEQRFPHLLIEVYKVVRKYHKDEQRFQKYFNGNLE